MSKSITPLMDARLTAEGAERGRLKAAAERDALAQRCRELEASRFAYASEFACDKDGDPDTGSIHFNIRAIKGERDTLRAEIEARDARIASLFQAIAHGDQPHREWLEAAIDAHFSGGRMPDQVPSETERLKAEVETLREIREIASQCAANGGYLSSADLIELRELLKK